MKLKYFCLMIFLVTAIALTSCGLLGEDTAEENAVPNTSDVVSEQPEQPSSEPVLDVEPTAAPDTSMYAINPFTGIKNMNISNVGKRPVAVMINNVKLALPQAGITDFDMIYEIPAEGGVSRIMGIYADAAKMPSVIGPVRSARDYYISIASGYNAVFAHFGTSTSADKAIKDNSVNNLDMMYLDYAYWRDQTRWNNKGKEHSAMTSGERLNKAISNKKYSMDSKTGITNAFNFYGQDNFTAAGTSDALKISAKFSGSYVAEFNYDTNTKLYGKKHFSAAHVDEKGNQIQITNVIVIYTKMTVLDKEGHLGVDLSSGKGYYFSGGKYKEINWSKGKFNDLIKYYNTDGTALTVNTGKTYVCIVDGAGRITMS